MGALFNGTLLIMMDKLLLRSDLRYKDSREITVSRRVADTFDVHDSW